MRDEIQSIKKTTEVATNQKWWTFTARLYLKKRTYHLLISHVVESSSVSDDNY